MNRSSCPACFSPHNSFKYLISNYRILQCTDCSSKFVETLPSQELLGELYKSNDYYSLPEDTEQRINNENKRRAANIKKIIPTGRVLDIGCAKGSLLDEMKIIKYDTYGLEMSARNVEICNSKGHDVFHGDLNSYFQSSKSKTKFNVITCLDVIEHVPLPKEFLNQLSELLDKEGIAVISTPNFSGIISGVLGKKDPFLIPPEHINFFSKKGLTKLVNSSGFNIIQIETFGYITKDGLERTVVKYFPKSLHMISGIIKPIINFSVRSLNLIKNGLELELYLRKYD